MLISDLFTSLSLIFFSYSILWSGNLYSIRSATSASSIRSLLRGSSFGLILVDGVSVALVISNSPIEANLVALCAGIGNLAFLVFSAMGTQAEDQIHYNAVCDTILFLSLTLLLASGVIPSQ